MNLSKLPFLSIREISELLHRKTISPVELVSAYLNRIERIDGKLHSFITVCREKALEEAFRAERDIGKGRWIGPFHGVPVAIKDQMKTEGIRTTNGSKLFHDYVPQEDSTVVKRLKRAGAIIIGKLNLSEFAVGGTRIHPYGTPRNPWDLECNPGESSSGSGIAVAASLCAGALGEDTGGSVRWPASWCGVVGLRPTYGRVSRYGIFPLSWSMDTPGPVTKNVEDCALMLQVIAGSDPNDATTSDYPVPDYTQDLNKGIQGIKVGVVKEYLHNPENDADVQECIQRSMQILRDAGALIEEVSIPLLHLATPIFVCTADVDFSNTWKEVLKTHGDDLDDNTRNRCLSALLIPPHLYHKGQRARQLIREKLHQELKEVDLLISPTGPKPAQKISSLANYFTSKEDVSRVMFRSRSYMSAYSLAGLPAISIPCGFTRSELPVGLQIASKPFQEGTILCAAAAFEAATDFHLRTPPIDSPPD